MKRVYHPYNLWEEFHAGMWRDVNQIDDEIYYQEAIKFTGNHELYGSWMLKVTEQWKYSCEHNLSCTSMNRQAWIGHAACCLAIKCPEQITRRAWHCLTKDQQDKANKKADEAIAKWESKQYENVSKFGCLYRNTKQSILGV